jgi:DNA-binding NtrC family response regulator
LKKYNQIDGKDVKGLTQASLDLLMNRSWPGNVRELENLVERLFTLCKGPVIHLKDIPIFTMTKTEIKDMLLKDAMKTFEKQYVGTVLESVSWNRTKAAEILGIHRNTLASKLNYLRLTS